MYVCLWSVTSRIWGVTVFRVTKKKKGESKVGPFSGEETEAKRRKERKLVNVFLVEKRKRVVERAKGKRKEKKNSHL